MQLPDCGLAAIMCVRKTERGRKKKRKKERKQWRKRERERTVVCVYNSYDLGVPCLLLNGL